MPVRAAINAVERSSYVVTASFLDANNSAAVPSSAWWSLEDDYGNAINSRANVPISAVSTQVDILLTNSDLALYDQRSQFELRRVVISAIYDSTFGAGISLSDSLEFLVYNTNKLR
jgi:hypothetical protein